LSPDLAAFSGSAIEILKENCPPHPFCLSYHYLVFEAGAILEPDDIGNDIEWETVAFVCVHPPILSVTGF
jgi:hypothetical protein